jgi:hypothetical protein
MDFDTIITIVIAIVLFGVAGGTAFAVKKVLELRRKLDTEVNPLLDDLKAKTEAMKPAVAQAGPLMEQTVTAMDALDVQVVKLDKQLIPVVNISKNVVHVLETISKITGNAKKALPKRS